jgi:hypothetical protein
MRCQGLAAVTKEVQRHRLLISTGSSGAACHCSAISAARALLKFACQLLEQARLACGTEFDPADACGQALADAAGALERHAHALTSSPPTPAAGTAVQCGNQASSGAQSGTDADGAGAPAPAAAPFIPRYARPVQEFDAAVTERDCKVLLVLALALPGSAAAELVDVDRLKAWLSVPGPGEAPAEAASRAANLMRLWRHFANRDSPAETLAAGARKLLERARCLRPGLEVYHAGDQACPSGAPCRWKTVHLTSADDRERCHSLLDFAAHRAMHCMMAELEDASQAALARLDILKMPQDGFIRQYLEPWDPAEMSEAQLDETVRPAMAAAIQQILAAA